MTVSEAHRALRVDESERGRAVKEDKIKIRLDGCERSLESARGDPYPRAQAPRRREPCSTAEPKRSHTRSRG